MLRTLAALLWTACFIRYCFFVDAIVIADCEPFSGLFGVGLDGYLAVLLAQKGMWEAEIAVVLHLAFSVILLAIEVPIVRIHIGLVSRIVGDIIVGSGHLYNEWKNNVHYVANHTSQGDGIPVHELDDEEYNQLFDEKECLFIEELVVPDSTGAIYDPSRSHSC
eukprot:s13121_g1.t1